MCDYNVFAFMGDHWLVTIILAIIAANVIRAPIDLAIVLAKRRHRDQIEPSGKPDIPRNRMPTYTEVLQRAKIEVPVLWPSTGHPPSDGAIDAAARIAAAMALREIARDRHDHRTIPSAA